MHLIRRHFTIACMLTMLMWGSLMPRHAFADSHELAIGLVAADSRELTVERWQPFIDGLAQKIGVPVKIIVLDDYAGVIWHLATGKAQLAWLGNKSAIEAVDRANCEVIARFDRKKSGGGYYSHLITQVDSPLNNVHDVFDNASELTFGNGDPNSTSGFIVPGFYLFTKNGKTPGTIFKRVMHNNHEGNFHAVANGTIDVATSNSLAVTRYAVHFPEESGMIKIIWTSPLIPSDPIVVRTDLSTKTRKTISDYFISYGKKTADKTPDQVTEEKAIMARLTWEGFVSSDNSQLIPIRKLELFKRRLRIERDAALSEQSKKKQFQIIDTQLRDLGT